MSGLIHSAPHSRRWALVPAAFALAAISVAYLMTHNFDYLGFALRRAFAFVCHQQPERSFWLFGAPLAVCSRCLGVYLGAAIGLLFRTSRRIAVCLVIASASLNLVDWLSEATGLHGNWITTRFFFGIMLGAAGALLISSSMGESIPTVHALEEP